MRVFNPLPVSPISIHALARRATATNCFPPPRPKDFNPRSRKESDLTGAFTTTGFAIFQSTLSQGERLKLN